MPTAQEVRAYLEKHGVQAALTASVNLAIQEQAPLAVTLWRYGLLSLGQLDQVLDWQDHQS